MDRLRQCIACRQQFARQTLIRVTYSSLDACVSINNEAKYQGRSVYICRKATCLAQALKKGRLPKVLKRTVPDDIVQYLGNVLKTCH